tara:strand:+ start:49 stop:1074 length:1026 start_codon:yes stop_codon:yes gene_type:complete
MKILITGGCGFVGSNIAIYLKKKLKVAKIYSLDNLARKGSRYNKNRLKKEKIKNFDINIEKFDKIKFLPKFNLIIDCCAEPAIEASKKEPDRVFNTNLIGTFNILKKCLKDNANIIFLSSSRVYSIKKLRALVKNLNIKESLTISKKINESFETESASSLYGFTKLSSEKLIKEFFYNTNLKFIINRFSVIAGPYQFGKQDQGFIPLWVAKHYFKKKLSFIGFGGHGNQVRDIIHIKDVCEILLMQIKRLNKINNHTFNIGGGVKNTISLKKLTSKCQNLTKNKIKIKKIKNTSIFDIPYFVSDNSKIYKFYNWKPSKSVDLILNDIYKWLSENKNLRNYF